MDFPVYAYSEKPKRSDRNLDECEKWISSCVDYLISLDNPTYAPNHKSLHIL